MLHKFKSFAKSLLAVCCLLGLTYQVTFTTILYLNYETTVTIMKEGERFIELPGIAICYETVDRLVRSRLYEAFSDLKAVLKNVRMEARNNTNLYSVVEEAILTNEVNSRMDNKHFTTLELFNM